MENRPTINRVWCSSGQNIRDPGDDKYAKGWVAEIPTSEVFNFLQNKIDKTFLAIGERGIPEWGSDISYKLGALVWNEADSTIYVALVENPDSKTSPDLNSSQWTKSVVQISRVEFDALNSKITEHISQLGETNPHQLTPHDVGTYTQQEIDAMFSANDNTNSEHIADMNNPHEDTAEKIGAVPVTGGTYEGTITMGSGVTELNESGTAVVEATDETLSITVSGSGLGVSAEGQGGLIKDGIFTPLGTAATHNDTEYVKSVNGHAPDTAGSVAVTSQDIFSGQAIAIPGAADLNDYTTPGLYYQSANVQAASGKNYPEPNAGTLEIYKNAGTTQVYRTYGSSRTYSRSSYNGSWSPWGKVYNTENKPTAADTGAVAKTGDTMSGNLTVHSDGGAIILKPVTAGAGSYVISKDSSGVNNWYVGYGSANTNTLSVTNYKTGSAMSFADTIAMSKSLGVSGTVTPTSYANFDARYNAKYPTMFRVGARVEYDGSDFGSKVPQGAVNINNYTNNDDRINGVVYAYLQFNLNGNWVNFS
jgi:hypothetical protein